MTKVGKFFRLFTSPYLTFFILLLITLSVIGGALSGAKVPDQQTTVAQNVVFSSLWFLVLNTLLLVITLLCTCRQGQSARQRFNRHKQKGKSAYLLGSPLFHMGIVVMYVGILIDIFAGSIGYMYLREGVLTEDEPRRYAFLDEGMLYPVGHGRFKVVLAEFRKEVSPKRIIPSGRIRVVDGRGRSQEGVIGINQQVNSGLVNFAGEKYGYYVYYKIFAPGGAVLADHSQGLDTIEEPKGTWYQREYRQPGTPYIFDVSFLPSVRKVKNRYLSDSLELRNQAIDVLIRKDKQEVYRGLIRKGEQVTMADGGSILFTGVLPYMLVRVQSMLGPFVLSAGVIVFLIGLGIHYFLPRPGRVFCREEGSTN